MKYEFDIEDLGPIINYSIPMSYINLTELSKFLKSKEIKEPKSFKIEVGKLYKNRKGGKCFVFKLDEYFYYVTVGLHESFIVYENGKELDYLKTDSDLISEWTEEDERKWSAENENNG